ncbi:MAG: fibronectin type III domain-containing protein, partial [Clostridiales bacterium]|nr:fibronectin type III domain-containing protein [Clostridiales bacterium]
LTSSNYSTSGTTTKPTRTNAGTTTVYYIAVPTSGTINANTVTTGSTTITINKLSMTVTATGYSGTYDGSSHTVTLKVSGPSSYKVYYSTSRLTSSNYSTSGTTTKPTRTNAGQTVVYYYIKESTGNYNDVSGNLYIYIKPKVTATAYAGVYDGSSHAATVTAAGSAKLYYSTSTKLTYSNYKSRGTTTKPTRRSVGTTTVYYIAVPTSGTINSSDVTTGSTTITILDRLSTPTLSSLTNSSSGVTVKWKKVAGASGYYIYRNGSKLKTITSGSTVSYTDTGAKNGTKYQYKIYAYSGSTKSYASSTKTIYYVSAVSISSLKNSSTKTMTVKWGKNSKATGYQIQYSTSSGFSNSKTVTVSGASKVSKTISSLTKGKKYYVRVRAYKTVSGTKYYSAWSSTKSVKISK